MSKLESPEYVDIYTDWYGFDTENDQNGVVTLAALVHESGETWVWKKAGEFVKWCDGQKGRPVVICHNLEYDLVNEFGELYPYLQLNYLKGRLISARYKNIKFLDSGNHFRMSLKKLGEAIGIKKLDMDIHDEAYVTTDSWICLKSMTQARDYIASIGGRIGATSGSSAVSVWEHMVEKEFSTGAVDTPWLRKGYYGGRTEIFAAHMEGPILRTGAGHIKYHLFKDEDKNELIWKGNEGDLRRMEAKHQIVICREATIKGYDINSMYPFCMKHDYPEYLMEDPQLNKAQGMAEVTISVPHHVFVAPLPYRTEEDTLWYPVGVFRGTWTYDEIRYAEKLGSTVIKVHAAYGCNTLVRPFDEFIDTLYAKRKASSNEAERLFLKVLMNSLYGKIASKSQVTRTVSRHTLLNAKVDRLSEVKWINHQRGLLDYFTPPPPYVNVCWGAMITANARLLLTRYLAKVPPEKLAYCDTDSLYANDIVLPESNELGGMKLERKAKVMDVVQPKAYRLDEFYKAKGVPKPRMVKDSEGRDTDKIEIDFAKQYIEDGFTEFQSPIRFRASLNTKRGKANQWVKHSKSRKSAYAHKRFSNGVYYPPIVGMQGELGLELPKNTKTKTVKGGNTKTKG